MRGYKGQSLLFCSPKSWGPPLSHLRNTCVRRAPMHPLPRVRLIAAKSSCFLANLTTAGLSLSSEANVRIQDAAVAGAAEQDFRRLFDKAKPMAELKY